ncbi:acyltransferase family protein [Paraglaciecola sp.]|uniref:acyltransferase family protein n=1 Tax=Paraglaciecola sp. TaxID=1920173 RepID=UPI003EF8AC5D
MQRKYFRWDIQGLRALAVMAVVIFHISPLHIPGGYLGVDVFFVVSGYLIIGFIVDDLRDDKFSLTHFYYRRLRRLVPAFYVMLLLTLPFSYYLLLPAEFLSYSKSVVSALVYVSNGYFYYESGYFDSGLKSAPLLHTWSLSVEEQFYIIIPFFLLIIVKFFRINISICLIVLAFFSFILSLALFYFDLNLGFYFSPARFWQFIVGGLLYLTRHRLQLNMIWTELVGAAGLVVLVSCFFVFEQNLSFPNLYSVIPTLATLMLLFAGYNSQILHVLLANRVGCFLGKISYSLYLWHWPVLVFYWLSVKERPTTMAKLGLVTLSIFLAWLSWRFAERKLADTAFNGAKKSLIMTISFGILISCVSWFALSLHSDRFNQTQTGYAEYIDYKPVDYRTGSCFLTSSHNNIKLFSQDKCIVNEQHKLNTLLLGDSHAAHWYEAMDQAKQQNETISQVTASGCRPLLKSHGASVCTDLMHWAINDLIEDVDFDKIILSGFWKLADVNNIKQTIEQLSEQTITLVVLGPTVEYHYELPRILALSSGISEANKLRLYNEAKVIDDALSDALKGVKNVNYISVLDTLCVNSHDCIMVTDDNIPIAFDGSHFTTEGAAHLLQKIGW